MKKNLESRGSVSWRLNYDLKMKLSLLLFLTMSFLMQANSTYAQKTKISMDKENAMLKEIIDEIEANTEFKFLFTTKTVDLNRKVTLNVKRASIINIIEALFDKSKISYEIDDRKILLKSKEIDSGPTITETDKIIEKPQTAVTGTVTDPAGMPMLGVNITVKGTSLGTVTDFDGNYSINISNANSILVFSYIGYETKEVAVAGKTAINVTLNESASALDEVVVTALGIKKESKRLAYAAETVQVEDLQANRTNNIGTSMVGKVAGLDISPPASGAGSSTKIRLRGQSGFAGANNSPLLVINGLPIDQDARGANGGNTRDRGDNLTNINPDDIESMTVLKGATAAALYGSRASNGAIIITTKSGAKNQGIGVELSSSFTANTVLDFTDYQMEYGQGQNGVRPSSQGNAATTGQFGWGEKYDGVPTVQFDGVLRPYSPLGRDRISEFYRMGTAMTNSIALSGGGEKGSFRASFAHTQSEGIDPANTYFRKIINVGFNQNITDKLSLSLNINYTHENNNNPPQVGFQGQSAANFLHRMSFGIPTSAFRDAAVDPVTTTERRTSGFQGTLINPYYLYPRQFFLDTRDRLLGTTTLRYEFNDWLYAQGRINYDFALSHNERNNPTGWGTSNPLNNAGTGFNGDYNTEMSTGTDLNADFLLGVNKEFGDFSVDVSVGGNIFKIYNKNMGSGAQSFIIRDLYTIENGVNNTQFYNINRSQINSLYAFADLGYKDILFLNATVRNDWFSVLNPDLNSYLYPSIGGSFIFSELMDAEWLTFGKLRASYADVGSASGSPAFSGILTYSINQNNFNGQKIGFVNGNSSPNPLIRPYSVSEKEIGLELRMFKSRVNLDLAVYEKVTTDQIIDVPLSGSTGYTQTQQNFGSIRGRGGEVLLDITAIQNDNFTWNTAINAGFNESIVESIAPGVTEYLVEDFADANEHLGRLYYVVGRPINQVAGRTFLRDDQGRIQVTPTGEAVLTGPSDYRYFGGALPKWTGGWTNTFTYKNLSLLVHMDFKAGGKVISSTHINALRQGHNKASLVGRDGSAPFPDAVIQGTDTPAPAPVNLQNFYTNLKNQQLGDLSIFRSDFIKLRTIALTYDLSGILRDQNSFIKGLTLSAACRNVALLYKDIPDLDPEAFASSGDRRVGYEQLSIPTTRDFTFNVNIKF
ncbi:SusC/RagA family TonB-linked outer membrane protein [Confluentibacter lentus]|uniref:SusC/RagA family TonB-linked outer membrane protein n=1 Tax=Confluentibacter lentus TaxID=1699412 RepID=UPI000C28BDA8|nr:SusC/RagA family TonB-linked outer membrane protein [Confluentibacter lentus]